LSSFSLDRFSRFLNFPVGKYSKKGYIVLRGRGKASVLRESGLLLGG
jgi:hypothetical protein